MNKKAIIAIIIGVILIIGGSVVVLYLFLFAEDSDKGLMDRLPFGEREEIVPTEEGKDEEGKEEEREDEEKATVTVRRISEHPVAEDGFIVFNKKDEDYVRYTSRGGGAIYEVKSTGKEHKMISEEGYHLSGLYRSFWLNKDILLAYLETSNDAKDLILAQLKEDSGTSTKRVGMPEDTTEAAFAPHSKSIFYTTKDKTGVNGFISSFDSIENVSGRYSFSSPIREWNIEWP
ncbi:MAG: hypothetical protein ACQESA_03685, partial [Patescibacteria group bacterium]